MTQPPAARLASASLLDAILDLGSFETWDLPADPPAAAGAGYRAELAAARERAGTDESVVSGEGRVAGHRVAVVCSEFAFLAGSLGSEAARRVVAAVERATAERLPLVLAPASGGTRMQEGTPAFWAMVDIADLVAEHRRAQLPVVVYLRNPVFGGALASWGSLGTVTLAEPEARIGFLGPKVYRALHGEDFPSGVQTAENLLAHGLVDALATPDEVRDVVRRVVTLTAGSRRTLASVATGPGSETPEPVRSDEVEEPDAWASVVSSRRADRPGLLDLLDHAAHDTVPLHGTGEGETAVATTLCLTRLGGSACVLVGQDRVAQRERPPGVADLRVARRGMALAQELGLPLVTVVDTPGAQLSAEAESGGLAGEIARCLAAMRALRVPTVSVLLGQGAGGAALSLLAADRVVVARHGWLMPLPPEGASAIVHGTPDRAPEMVATQRVRSVDLVAQGVADRVVDERPDAADEPLAFLSRLVRTVEDEIAHATSVHGARYRSRPATAEASTTTRTTQKRPSRAL